MNKRGFAYDSKTHGIALFCFLAESSSRARGRRHPRWGSWTKGCRVFQHKGYLRLSHKVMVKTRLQCDLAPMCATTKRSYNEYSTIVRPQSCEVYDCEAIVRQLQYGYATSVLLGVRLRSDCVTTTVRLLFEWLYFATLLRKKRAQKSESVGCYFQAVSCQQWSYIQGNIALFFPRQFLHELEACAKNPDDVPKVILRHVSDNWRGISRKSKMFLWKEYSCICRWISCVCVLQRYLDNRVSLITFSRWSFEYCSS